MTDKVEQLTNEAAAGLKEVGREVRRLADDTKKDAVKMLQSAADTLRREAREAGASRDVRDGADQVARSMERAAHYLKRHSYEDMGEDVKRNVRRNPWRAVGVVFVVGLVVGLLLRGER